MPIGLDQAPEVIGVALAEKADGLNLGQVRRVVARQILHIQAVAMAIDEGANETPFMQEMQTLRGGPHEIRVAGVGIIGSQRLAKSGGGVDHDQEDRRSDRQLVALEFQPHQLPLRGEIDLFLRRAEPGDRQGIERRGRDEMLDAGWCQWFAGRECFGHGYFV